MDKSTENLLKGERLAHEIIHNAELEKSKMQQNATFEAKQELAQIKQELNDAFNELQIKKERESENLQVYEDQADKDVAEIQKSFAQNKEAVLELLLDRIMNVQIELPKVVIGNFEKSMV